MNNPFTIVPDFLRDPTEFFKSISRGESVGTKARSLAISSILFLMIFGFVTGLSHSFLQAASSAVKMPILFVATMFFCLPAFYFFSLVLGTKLSLAQVTVVVLLGISVTGFLLLGLSPVTLFFVLTSSNYPFFKLLAAIFVAVSGCVGMFFLWRGMVYLDGQNGVANLSLRRPLLGLLFVLYAFMGSQMTWRLSPFVGDPTQPFVLIQPSRDNFYVDVIKAFFELTGVQLFELNINTFLIGLACLFPLIALLFTLGWVVERRGKVAAPKPTVQQERAQI